jgi:hypothetical protein
MIDLGQFGLPRPDRADRKPQRGTKIAYSEPQATTRRRRKGDNTYFTTSIRRAERSYAGLSRAACQGGERDVFVFGQEPYVPTQ